MDVVSFIFDSGATIMKNFAKVAEWFVTPLYFERPKYATWPFNLAADYIADMNGLARPEFSDIAVTPFSILVGAGLTAFLTAKAVKWVKEFIV